MKKYLIGVDIGGTNTDVVLLDEKKKIIACTKEITSRPIEQSVTKAILKLLESTKIAPSNIDGIFLGTTHATNATLEAKELLQVGLIRIAGHRPDSSPAFFWPENLQKAVLKGYECLDGGFECHGSPITVFDRQKAIAAIQRLLVQNVQAIAVVGCFSAINSTQELEVLALIQEIAGSDFPVAISSAIGGIGFLERENATLLNASLKKVISDSFRKTEQSLLQCGLNAPLYMVQNDGSIMNMQLAIEMPILTIGAGQTNSFIGACKVAGIERACVVDIGGTSTDIGVVENSIPKRSCQATKIGGVELQFAMPDVLSLALGGGSIITNKLIGPQSVARLLKEKAQCFGGDTLTFTDVGVVLGILDIPGADPAKVLLSIKQAKELLLLAKQKLAYGIKLVLGKEKNLPIIVVGGASALVKAALDDYHLVIPEHAHVANAYGAALAELSVTTTLVASLGSNRQALLDDIKAKTCQAAILRGADATKTRVVSVEIIPYAYSKEGLAKISVTAMGPR